MIAVPFDPRTNRLLAALPEAEWQRWAPHLEPLDMLAGQELCGAGRTQDYVYFPVSAVVSLLYVMENGDSAEMAVVGQDGVVGISLFMGGRSTCSRAVVQSAGKGMRLPAQRMLEEFNRGGPTLRLLLRYTQALMTQMAQMAVCNRHHVVDQQLSRWLLTRSDRLGSNEVMATQESVAQLLGVRREGVTESAIKLQQAGYIRYARGHVTILNREGLEHRSCECYAVLKREYNRLLPEKEAA